ncbi:ABC transporter ATP-binding protein [Agromyces marinus]|nr:ABC transporter ATP-binding protein [Agromyces marinus]UIP58835.1 Putative HMP/thiamine import ATP-binding protein YkoD [Agromyces marinus]
MPAVRPARLVAEGWGWRHAGRRRAALHGLDLVIEPGERVLLLGASGSGKSTLLHAFAGVLGGEDEGEQHGTLRLDGVSPVAARGRAGLVLQDPDSQVILARVGDDVAFGCENLGVARDEIWSRVREAVHAVALDLPLDHPTSRLSGGQKQRLALAGALAMRPGLLLLDEPTANLDPEGVAEVRRAVARVVERTGATMVVVEHRVDVWVDLVDRVIVLDADGGVLADGTPASVLAEQGRSLAAKGVWVPGIPLDVPGAADATRADAPSALEAAGLAIGRPRGAVLHEGLAFDVPEAASTVLTGPNGVGKSTLALTLGGLLPPRDGRVVAAPGIARGIGEEPHRWRSRELLTRIGTVFQEPEHQFVASNVRDEIAVAPRALGLAPADVDARVDEVLQRLRLDHLAGANPFTLSGGEARRLSVGAVLATRPRVVILDEPTFGQDRLGWIELVRLLHELVADGASLLSVTHDAAFTASLGGRCIALTPGGPVLTNAIGARLAGEVS